MFGLRNCQPSVAMFNSMRRAFTAMFFGCSSAASACVSFSSAILDTE